MPIVTLALANTEVYNGNILYEKEEALFREMSAILDAKTVVIGFDANKPFYWDSVRSVFSTNLRLLCSGGYFVRFEDEFAAEHAAERYHILYDRTAIP